MQCATVHRCPLPQVSEERGHRRTPAKVPGRRWLATTVAPNGDPPERRRNGLDWVSDVRAALSHATDVFRPHPAKELGLEPTRKLPHAAHQAPPTVVGAVGVCRPAVQQALVVHRRPLATPLRVPVGPAVARPWPAPPRASPRAAAAPSRRWSNPSNSRSIIPALWRVMTRDRSGGQAAINPYPQPSPPGN